MANKIVNTFETGLVKVPNKTKQPKNSYSYALNAVPNNEITDRSSRTNERGFDNYIQLKSQEYVIVGSQWLADEQYVLFIKHKEGATSPFNEIWYVDIKEGIQELKYANLGLNFKDAHPITSTYRTDYRNHRIVYWVDGINDDRVIDIDDPNVSSLDPSAISMNSSEIKPTISVESEDFGGAVKTGQYFVAVAYKDSSNYITGASSFSKPVTIVSDNYLKDYPIDISNSRSYILTNGSELDIVTQKKLEITIDDIDSRYDKLIIYIVQVTDTFTKIYTTDDLNISGSTFTFEFTGLNVEEDTSITINDLVVNRINYYASNIINQKENRLIRGNLKIKENKINYQQIANNIKVTYDIEEELVCNTSMIYNFSNPATESLSTEERQLLSTQNYAITPKYLAETGNTIGISSKTFMRDEVYALGISFELNDGTETDVFHIPGRALNSFNSTAAGSGEFGRLFSNQTNWDNDIIDSSPRWLNHNTAIKRSVGLNELAYWRSDEVYPDGYGYPTDGEQDGTGKTYIRHHKMPSDIIEPIYQAITVKSDPVITHQITKRNLKLIFNNVVIPVEYNHLISRIRFHYVKRDNSNKSIVSKGLLYGADAINGVLRQSPQFNLFNGGLVHSQFISPDVTFNFKQFPITADRWKTGYVTKGYITYYGRRATATGDYWINLINNYTWDLNSGNPPHEQLQVGTTWYVEKTLPLEANYNRPVQGVIFTDANSSGTPPNPAAATSYNFSGEENSALIAFPITNVLPSILADDYPTLDFETTGQVGHYPYLNYDATSNTPDAEQINDIYYDTVYYGSLVRNNRTQYGNINNLIYIDSGSSYENTSAGVYNNLEVKNGDCFIDIHYVKKGYSINNTQTGFHAARIERDGETGLELNTDPIGKIVSNSYVAFLVETDLNIRVRNTDPNVPEQGLNYWPISPLDSTDNITYSYEKKSTGTEYNNIYPSYNLQNLKEYFANDRLLVDFNNKESDKYENRLIYSDKQSYEDTTDSFRITRANNYKDLPMDKGPITQSFIKDDKFFVLTRDALFNVYASNKALQTLDGENMTVGTGEFFGLEPVELISIKGGFGGTSSKYSLSESPYGYLFIDRLKSKAILFNDQLKDINIGGLNEDYTLNLFKQFPELKINGDFDNPLIGPGIISIYDPRLHRLIISKKDYIALSEVVDNYKGLFNPDGVYAVGDIVAKDGVLVEITDIVEEYLIFTTLSNPSSFTFSLITTSAVAVNARDNNSVLDTTAVSSNANKTLNLSSGNTPININILASPSLVTSITANDRDIISVNTSIYDNLSILDLDTNAISNINLSDNINLTGINIANNNLSVLDVSNNVNLTTLEADNNNLSTLDVSNNPQLKWYLAGFNNLSSVNLSNNPDIVWIRVRNNNLSTLNTSNCTLLERLEANNNNIPSFNFSSNPNITHLDIGNNPVSSLSLGNLSQLEILYVSACNLTTIDLSSNSNLVAIQIAENNLTTLDIFHLPNLQALDCTKNANLGGFNVSNNNQLTDLRCGECAFTADGADPAIIDAIIIKMDNNITSGGVLHYAASNSEGIQPTSASLAAYNSLISKGCDVRGKTPA